MPTRLNHRLIVTPRGRTLHPVYLTNALGELTGRGSDVIDADVAAAIARRVPFDSPPGHLLFYVVEQGARAWVLGVLELPYDDPWWSRDEAWPSYERRCAQASAILADIARAGMPEGARLMEPDYDMPGRVAIGVAIALADLVDEPDSAVTAMRAAFGQHCTVGCEPAVATG